MAKLTSAQRKAMPASEYGLPQQRAFPMPDANHARLAKAMASEAEHKGNITPAQEAQIDRKADAILHNKVSDTRTGRRHA